MDAKAFCGRACRHASNQPFHLSSTIVHLSVVVVLACCCVRSDAQIIVNTVAGSGGSDASAGYSGDGFPATSALLNTPRAVAIYSDGTLYIADQGNSVIRKVNGTTSIITTIAGTGVSSTSGDGGPATSAGLSGPYDVALIGLVRTACVHCLDVVHAVCSICFASCRMRSSSPTTTGMPYAVWLMAS